jgi:hypothetical protein
LIMLSLVSHEPHFCLLREVVKFGGGGSGQPSREVLENPSEEGFQLLQIALLRDYLDAEFKPAAPPAAAGAKGAKAAAAKDAALLPFGYDLERIVDDFVFLAMLVGNDFLPPLPTLDIAEGALNSLFDIYKEELPAMGGYLTNEGVFDAARLERILARLAALEEGVLAQRCVCAHALCAHRRIRNASALTMPFARPRSRPRRAARAMRRRRRSGRASARRATPSAAARRRGDGRRSWTTATRSTRCARFCLCGWWHWHLELKRGRRSHTFPALACLHGAALRCAALQMRGCGTPE